uniref:Putative secreted protein n=1 Tax=Ixodes ricinus TaxID=34613 RepID=A0A147BCD3_IXORI
MWCTRFRLVVAESTLGRLGAASMIERENVIYVCATTRGAISLTIVGDVAVKCKPDLTGTKFLRKAKQKTEREIIEAFYIKKKENNCVSAPSLYLLQSEMVFLEGWL